MGAKRRPCWGFARTSHGCSADDERWDMHKKKSKLDLSEQKKLPSSTGKSADLSVPLLKEEKSADLSVLLLEEEDKELYAGPKYQTI
ncbi:hypothetical protein ACP4OV_007820 [Aristida adscensionis]